MNKAELLAAIREEYARLEGLVKDMGEDELAAPGVVGQWSVKDILAHLTAWNRLLPGWLEAARIGATPIMPSEGYTWRDMDRLNAAIYHANKDSAWDKVINEFREAHQRVLHEVEALSEDELTNPQRYNWMGGKPLTNLIASDTHEHYKEFADHLQEWTQVQGGS